MEEFALPGRWRIELLPASPYQAAYAPETPIIGFACDGQIGVHAFGGDRRTDFRARPNGLAYVPAGCDVYSASDRGGEYLKITFAAGGRGDWPGNHQFSDAIDREAIAAAEGLRRLLLSSHHHDPLGYERFVLVLQAVSAGFAGGDREHGAEASWMTPRRLKLIDELIESELEARLTVQALADHPGLSTGFFSRTFSAAIGKPPYDYIIDRRMARARALLQDRELDLAAVASASGFSSHAHMTATFRNRLGMTPSALRNP